jgi:hypothetical protein
MQHYVTKFDSDLWQVGGFLRALHQSSWPPRYNSNIVESGLNTIILTLITNMTLFFYK